MIAANIAANLGITIAAAFAVFVVAITLGAIAFFRNDEE